MAKIEHRSIGVFWVSALISRVLRSFDRRAAPTRARHRLTPSHHATIWSDQSGAIQVTTAARRLLELDDAASLGEPGAVFSSVADGGDGLSAAMKLMATTGAPFSEIVRLKSGAVVEARGAPVGAAIEVALIDQTTHFNALARERSELADAEARVARLERALAATWDVAWTPGSAGAVEWRSTGFEDLSAEAQAALSAASPTEDEPARVLLNGGVRAFDVIAAPGRLAGSEFFVARDVSEAHTATTAMNRLVHTMSETFAHVRIGLMIFDPDQRLTLFNPAITDVFNGGAEWLARRPTLRQMLDRLREERAIPEQIDFASWRDQILKRVRSDDFGAFQETWHIPDGRSFIASFRSHTPGGLAVVLEDITESVALRRTNMSERAVRLATIDHLAEGLVVCGPDGRIRTYNPALRTIWSLPDDICDPDVRVVDLIEACERSTGPHPFWASMKGEATNHVTREAREDRLKLSDGRLILARLSPMPDGSSLAVFSDVTATDRVAEALKERNEVLEHAEEMRCALVDQISHQLRTPLNSIYGFAQLLTDDHFGDLTQVQREYVENIIGSSGDLLEAIDSLSDLIAVGAEVADDADIQPVFIEDALRDVVALTEHRFKERRGGVDLDIRGEPVQVTGHPVRLRQIMFNMLSDALARAPRGRRVQLRLRRNENELTLECEHDDDADFGLRGQPGLALALLRRFVRLQDGETEVEVRGGGRRLVRCRLPMNLAKERGAGLDAGVETG